MARSFNGTSDLIIVDAAVLFSELAAFSVAAWLKASGALANATWYGEGRAASANPFFQAQVNSGKARFAARGDSGGTAQLNSISTTATVADGTWHHAIFTQDATSGYQFYVDGVLDRSSTYARGATTTDRATIGALRRTTAGENFYGGVTAIVATFSRQLTADEALLLASGEPPSVIGPDHYWRLVGRDSPEPDNGAAAAVNGVLTGTTPADGPVQVDTPSFMASLGRRPVPMIKGPDTDRIAGMRGRFK